AWESFMLRQERPVRLLFTVRVLALTPAHLFFAGVWGFALGAGRRGYGRWFPLAWSLSVLLHGLYDHLMLARGPALLLTAVPLLGFMFGAAWIVLRSLA